MFDEGSLGRVVPAVVVLLLGLGTIGVAGAGLYEFTRPKYSYDTARVAEGHGPNVYHGVYHVESLPADAQAVLTEAPHTDGLDADLQRALLAAPQFSESEGRYVVHDTMTEVCVSKAETDTPPDSRISVGCQWRVAGYAAYDYANLSTSGKAVVRESVAAADGTVTRYGESPPEFEAGAPGDLGAPPPDNAYDPIYVVRYDDEAYRLDVTDHRNNGDTLLTLLFCVVGVVGLGFAAPGAYWVRSRRVRSPTAVLVGLGVIATPLALAYVRVVSLFVIVGILPGIVVAGLASAVLARWALGKADI